jgi:hypothetical protein
MAIDTQKMIYFPQDFKKMDPIERTVWYYGIHYSFRFLIGANFKRAKPMY